MTRNAYRHEMVEAVKPLLPAGADANLHLVHAFLHDAASNVSKAENDLGADLICVVHAINLAFKQAYTDSPALKDLCERAGELTSFFSHSSASRQVLVEMQNERIKNRAGKPIGGPVVGAAGGAAGGGKAGAAGGAMPVAAAAAAGAPVAPIDMYSKPLLTVQHAATRFLSRVLVTTRAVVLLPILEDLAANEELLKKAFSDAAKRTSFKSTTMQFKVAAQECAKAIGLCQRMMAWLVWLSGRHFVTADKLFACYEDLEEACQQVHHDDGSTASEKGIAKELEDGLAVYLEEWIHFDRYKLAELLGIRNFPSQERLPLKEARELLQLGCKFLVYQPPAADPMEEDDDVEPEVVGGAAGQQDEPLDDLEQALLSEAAQAAALKAAQKGKKKGKAGGAAADAAQAQEDPHLAAYIQVVAKEIDEFFVLISKLRKMAEFREQVASQTFHFFDNFWSLHKLRLPNLWLLARIVLSTPVSAIGNESAFSVLAAIDAPGRQSLLLDRLCRLTMMNLWEKATLTTERDVPPCPMRGVPVKNEQLAHWLEQAEKEEDERQAVAAVQDELADAMEEYEKDELQKLKDVQ